MDMHTRKLVRYVLTQLNSKNQDFRRKIWFYVFVELLGQKELNSKVRTKKADNHISHENGLSADMCNEENQQYAHVYLFGNAEQRQRGKPKLIVFLEQRVQDIVESSK